MIVHVIVHFFKGELLDISAHSDFSSGVSTFPSVVTNAHMSRRIARKILQHACTRLCSPALTYFSPSSSSSSPL